MTTLYIRDVSEQVAETLKERAAAPTNAEIVARLKACDRSTGPIVDDIVAAVQAGRR